MSEIIYQRLTRPRARQFLGVVVQVRSSLWLGPDHLLCVDTHGYTERYKRFHYRDIQAVVLRQTRRRMIAAWLLGALGGLLTACAVALSGEEPVGSMVVGLMAAPVWVGFIFNFLAGPTTTAYLRTAVQSEELPSLHRLGQARRALAKLRPRIAAAQGELAPGEATARHAQLLAATGYAGSGGEVPPHLTE